VGRGGRLFFTHDPRVAMARLEKSPEGRFGPVDERERVEALPL